MAEFNISNFPNAPYFDDFTKAKKFLRILFRPGYSVQARELTQIQTILQGQVTSVGDYMFKDGSVVSNGQFTTHPCKYLRVEQTVPSGAQTFSSTNFVNNVISSIGTSSVTGAVIENTTKAKILHIEEPTAADPYYVFFYENLEGDTLEADIDAKVTGTGSADLVLTTIAYDSTNQVVNTDKRIVVKKKTGDWKDKVQSHGDAVLASNDEGIFYLDGYYVLGSKQTISLSKNARKLSTIIATSLANEDDGIEIENSSAPGTPPTAYNANLNNFVAWVGNEELEGVRLFQFPSSRVGFDILRENISSNEDVTLLDNAYGSYNYAAPGADRYRISLTLKQYQFFNDENQAKLSDFTSGSKFIEKLRVLDGEVSLVEKYPTISDLEDTLARRTYDESGNYTIRPFEFDVKEYLRRDEYIITRKMIGITDAFIKDTMVNGINPDGTAWSGVVVCNDSFLGRFGELEFKDVDDGGGTPTTYGTTKLYPISGVPQAGSTVVRTTTGVKAADIATQTQFDTLVKNASKAELATSVFLPATPTETTQQGYTSVYAPVDFVSDPLNGSNSLSSLGITGASGILDASKKLEVSLSSGKAYVFGYDYEITTPQKIALSKSRTTASTTKQEVPFSVGNYVVCTLPDGTNGNLSTGFDLAHHKTVDLWGTAWGGTIASLSKMGTAKIRTVNFNTNSSEAEVYLYDVVMDSGKTFKQIQRIYRQGTVAEEKPLFEVSITGGTAAYSSAVSGSDQRETLLFGSKSNSLIVPLPTNTSVKTVTELGKVEISKTFVSGSVESPATSTTVKYISFSNLMTDEYYIDIANIDPGQIQDFATVWSGSDTSIDTVDSAWHSAFGNEYQTWSVIPADYLKTRYSLINHANGKVYDLSGSDFLVATKYNNRSQIIVAIKGSQVEEFSGKVTLMCTVLFNASTTTDLNILSTYQANVSEFAKKTLTHSETLETPFSNFFDSNSVLSGTDLSKRLGYLKIPCKNYQIYSDVNGTMTPRATRWASFEDPADVTSPLYYETSLGVSDVYEVDEIFCLYNNGKDDKLELRDITEYFEFDLNTTDNLYDHSKVFISKDNLQTLKVAGCFPRIDANDNLSFNTSDHRDYTLYFRFRFFEREGKGPVIANSYNHDDHHPTFDKFEDIPLHVSSLYGTTTELRNCLDYRPMRVKANPAKVAYSITGGIDNYAEIKDNFVPGNNDSQTSIIKPIISVNATTNPLPEVSYMTYLPRYSKIMLSREREMLLVDGEPAVLPETPNDMEDAMTLYSLQVPEYTYNSDDVDATYVDLRRYTMEDIGKLEKRIENIEYYASLSLLEKETEDKSVKDSFGTERVKNGILVDDFKGHAVGDVLSKDYNCAMDFETGELRPTFESVNVGLVDATLDSDGRSGLVKTKDRVVTRRYTGDKLDTSGNKPPKHENQPFASKAISVNPFDVTNWLGSGKLSPSSDTWIDNAVQPKVKTNFAGENDAWEARKRLNKSAFGTQWNDWSTLWSGTKIKKQDKKETDVPRLISPKTKYQQSLNSPKVGTRQPRGVVRRYANVQNNVSKTTPQVEQKKTGKGIKSTLAPKRVEKAVLGKTVDTSVVPFIRAKRVLFTADGMKPNTKVYAFFDGVNVDKYCTGAAIGVTWDKTDKYGKAALYFDLPAGMFQTGEREFRLTDDPNNNEANSTTAAEAIYYAQGMLQQKTEQIVATRMPVVKRATVKSNKIVPDAVSREKIATKDKKNEFRDPVAQTFTIDAKKNPEGVWVHSVNLFFSTKPTEEIPVVLQIRPAVKGIPHASMVLPFAEVSVDRELVKTAPAVAVDKSDVPDPDNANTYTQFEFSSPVFLKPGEYAIVVQSNSADYRTYISEMAQTRIGATERINTRASSGMFFASQNGSTWKANPNMDLMYTINRCEFKKESEQKLEFQLNPDDLSSDGKVQASMIKLISSDVQFDTSKIKAVLKVDSSGLNDPEEYTIPLNENIEFPLTKEMSNTNFKIEMTIDDTSDNLTPVLDLDRFSLVAVRNKITPRTANDESQPFAPTSSNDTARYITRRVELQEGVEADDLKVYLSGYRPKVKVGADEDAITTDIAVYARVQTIEDDRKFEELPWIEMDLDPAQLEVYSDKEGEFIEYEYAIPEQFYNPLSRATENTGYSKEYEAFGDPISRYCFKIVLNSSNSGVIPKVKDFKAIAVT